MLKLKYLTCINFLSVEWFNFPVIQEDEIDIM
jgi:hypothetical protein